MVGAQPSKDATNTRADWNLDTALPSVHTGRPRLILEVPSGEEEKVFLQSSGGEVGIYEVAFAVEDLHSGYPEEGTTPHGRIRFVGA